MIHLIVSQFKMDSQKNRRKKISLYNTINILFHPICPYSYTISLPDPLFPLLVLTKHSLMARLHFGLIQLQIIWVIQIHWLESEICPNFYTISPPTSSYVSRERYLMRKFTSKYFSIFNWFLLRWHTLWLLPILTILSLIKF